MEQTVFAFSPAGTVQGMHTDNINLAHLGPQQIERTVDLRFNTRTQTWGLHPVEGPLTLSESEAVLGGFRDYETARQVEVIWINACRAIGCEPSSEIGRRLAKESAVQVLQDKGLLTRPSYDSLASM